VYLLLGGVEREVSHVEGRRILQLVLELGCGLIFASLLVLAAIPLTSVLRVLVFSCLYARIGITLLVAYELGLSRRSMVLFRIGAMVGT
jgi:hypothetical protein